MRGGPCSTRRRAVVPQTSTFGALLLCALLSPRAAAQSLSSVYWTNVVGQQQPGAYAALSVVNASGVQIFGGAAGVGQVPTTVYLEGERGAWRSRRRWWGRGAG